MGRDTYLEDLTQLIDRWVNVVSWLGAGLSLAGLVWTGIVHCAVHRTQRSIFQLGPGRRIVRKLAAHVTNIRGSVKMQDRGLLLEGLAVLEADIKTLTQGATGTSHETCKKIQSSLRTEINRLRTQDISTQSADQIVALISALETSLSNDVAILGGENDKRNERRPEVGFGRQENDQRHR